MAQILELLDRTLKQIQLICQRMWYKIRENSLTNEEFPQIKTINIMEMIIFLKLQYGVIIVMGF